MLQEAKDLQNRAVTRLVSALSQGKKEYTFKAPTGSGKTYMMADFINRILATHSNVVFIVSSLSKSELAEQNYNSFCALVQNGTFPNLDPYLINSDSGGEGSLHIPTDHNVYVLPRDLYKDKSKLKEEGTFLNFLQTTTGNLLGGGGAGKSVFVIKDECHIATSNLDELSHYFSVVINYSATPKLSRRQLPDVEISNTAAEEAKLIKQVAFQQDTDSLDTALDKFEEIKADYTNKLRVNPCFIIQISNKDRAEEELNNTIFPTLGNTKHQDLKWVYITGDKSGKGCQTNDSGLNKLPVARWKDYMKGQESSISVIIFKMVISEGWDIPRACMLYQVRDTQSKQLDEQVMGRVRRNPRLLDFERLPKDAQDLASTAWIWGIKPKEMGIPKPVSLFRNYGIEEEIRVTPTKLKIETIRKDLDLPSLLKDKRLKVTGDSIFTMYRTLMQQDNEVLDLCYDYADAFWEWRLFVENVGEIKKKFYAQISDYEKSMTVCKSVSFPYGSFYNETGKTLTLDDWIWFRKEGDETSDEFSFDSDAEKKWAELLKDIRTKSIGTTNNVLDGQDNKFLWGKNFPLNSEIKFEFFADGVHSSYPDFVMKDKKGRIHIFEVKSVNVSPSQNVSKEEYETKIRSLKECYEACSKKTSHIFYLPVLDGNTWKITRFENGEESTIDKKTFVDSLSE
ncbi:MAG: DEAD/DEAH box helicase family protein [Paludibacteraceae bacterium]|nr:DEAD/DEAH box helicase family protein [Paludibacteraceae bacterium]